MSDEAFARRFYSDRAELLSLGVPLQSQRDEFTGEELYTLRSEQYFLPQLELEDEELAALQTAFYLLEGKFAYAEPLRLALQNLALGRPGFTEAPTETASRVEVLDPDYSPETPGRLAKLENAISKQRTVRFDYWSISRDKESERTLNPYALHQRQRALVRRRPRPRPRGHPHLPRLAHPRRHQVRDAARARLPRADRLRRRALPRPAAVADRRHRRHRADRGARRHGLVGAARLRRDGHARGRRLRHRVLLHPPARVVGAAPERPRGAARAGRAQARRRGRRCGACANGHEGEAPQPAREKPAASGDGADRASRRPRGARAVRRPPGAARLPPRGLRRGARGRDPGRRSCSSASPRSRRTSSRSISRCSTSSTSAAAATRSTPSCATARCTSTRSCGATRSAPRRA